MKNSHYFLIIDQLIFNAARASDFNLKILVLKNNKYKTMEKVPVNGLFEIYLFV